MIPSPDDQERLAVVIPFPSSRRHARPDGDRATVEAGDKHRAAVERSKRMHPSWVEAD